MEMEMSPGVFCAWNRRAHVVTPITVQCATKPPTQRNAVRHSTSAPPPPTPTHNTPTHHSTDHRKTNTKQKQQPHPLHRGLVGGGGLGHGNECHHLLQCCVIGPPCGRRRRAGRRRGCNRGHCHRLRTWGRYGTNPNAISPTKFLKSLRYGPWRGAPCQGAAPIMGCSSSKAATTDAHLRRYQQEGFTTLGTKQVGVHRGSMTPSFVPCVSCFGGGFFFFVSLGPGVCVGTPVGFRRLPSVPPSPSPPSPPSAWPPPNS